MHWGTKPAISMMIAVVFWAAAPLIACLPGLGAGADRDCCPEMAMPHCGGESMASGSCCGLTPAPSDLTALSPYAMPHAQQSGWLMEQPNLRVMADPLMGHPRFHEIPLPDPSPGGLSVLRI